MSEITSLSASNDSAPVKHRLEDHVAYITIDRPERSNAISAEVRRTLIEMFSEASVDPDVWAVVLTGAGPKAFCAGGDLKDMNEAAKKNAKYVVPMTGPDRNLYETVLETYKPTIAAVNGAAFGGGFELAMACDIRIASSNATFALPEAKRGMGANFGSVLLPRLIPHGIALQMLYTGDSMSAQDAKTWGLVNQIVDPGELAETVKKFAQKLVKNAPLTLRRYKHMAVKGWDMPLSSALRLDVGPNPYTSEDRLEGVRAFVEKRQPVWSGK